MSSKHSVSTPQAASLARSRSASMLSSPSKKALTSLSECPLSSPDLGVISENDHRVGLCLCPTCTCGQHKCPSQLMKEPYPKSIFNSYYNQEFQKRSPTQPIKINNNCTFYTKIPMECITSYDNFFKPPQVKTEISSRGVPSPSPKPVFGGASSYKLDFPSWGSGGAYYVKQSHIRHSDPDMKLHTRTSYGETFKPMTPSDLKQVKIDADIVGQFRATVSLKTSNAKFISTTTAKSDFQDFSRSNLTVKASRDSQPIPKASVSSSHFKSASQSAFRAFKVTPDHRATRRAMERERLNNAPGFR